MFELHTEISVHLGYPHEKYEEDSIINFRMQLFLKGELLTGKKRTKSSAKLSLKRNLITLETGLNIY
jgi:ubiquitin